MSAISTQTSRYPGGMTQAHTSRTSSPSPSPVAANLSADPRVERKGTHRHHEAVHRDVHRGVRRRHARATRAATVARARARRRQLERLVVGRALTAAIAHQPEHVVAAVQSAEGIAVSATKARWSAVIRLRVVMIDCGRTMSEESWRILRVAISQSLPTTRARAKGRGRIYVRLPSMKLKKRT